MPFSNTVPVKSIDAKHVEWRSTYQYWERLRKLYEGGHILKQSADEFLPKRSMEPVDQYADRIARFEAPDHLGNIVGYYVAALYKNPPDVTMRKHGVTGEGAILKADSSDVEELNKFSDNVDANGHSILKFFRESVCPKLLVYKKAYVLFDLPTSELFPSLAQQKQAGALVPYLISYCPQDVINWQTNPVGALDWIVIKLRQLKQDQVFDTPKYSDLWYLYDRSGVAVYRYDWPDTNEKGAPWSNGMPDFSSYPTNAVATLQRTGPHALTDKNQVPVFVQELAAEHWLGNRLASPLNRLIAKENEYDWSLEQSALAFLIVFSNREFNTIKRSEVGFLQLDPTDKAEYLVPDSAAYDHLQKRVIELREEVYRLAYLVTQGRSSSASASMQSGYSKEQDMLPARDVLSALGDQAREALQQILQEAADCMGLEVDVDVQGLNFSDRTDMISLEVMERVETVMPIQSPRYEKEVQKRLVRESLPDLNREVLGQIDGEIDTNPTPSEQAQEQQEQQASMRLKQLAANTTSKAFADAEAA